MANSSWVTTPPATYNPEAPKYITHIKNRLQIQEKQVYIAFNKNDEGSPKKQEGQAAFALHEKLNEYMQALDQEMNQVTSITRWPIKPLHFTEWSAILIELKSNITTHWFKTYCKDNNLLACIS